jgi:hypothetical protein
MRTSVFIFLSLHFCGNGWAEEGRTDGGTTVSVQVSDGGQTNLAVQSGALTVRAAGQSERVESGEGVRVDVGKPPKRIPLLPAPRVISPSDGQRIGSVRIWVVWAEVKSAERYRLLISRDTRFSALVAETTSEGTKTQVSVPAPGTYYFRVSAVAQNGLRGRPSPARRFVVDTTPPSLKTGKPEWQ